MNLLNLRLGEVEPTPGLLVSPQRMEHGFENPEFQQWFSKRSALTEA